MAQVSRRVVFLAMILLYAGSLAAAETSQTRLAQNAPARPQAASPLAAEMTTLESVMQEMVSAIANADGTRVVKAVAMLREPGEKTHQALRAGALTVPKNGDRMDDFQRSYESFHAHIDALGRAGSRENVEAMLMLTKQLLENCVTCHRTFRR